MLGINKRQNLVDQFPMPTTQNMVTSHSYLEEGQDMIDFDLLDPQTDLDGELHAALENILEKHGKKPTLEEWQDMIDFEALLEKLTQGLALQLTHTYT